MVSAVNNMNQNTLSGLLKNLRDIRMIPPSAKKIPSFNRKDGIVGIPHFKSSKVSCEGVGKANVWVSKNKPFKIDHEDPDRVK